MTKRATIESRERSFGHGASASRVVANEGGGARKPTSYDGKSDDRISREEFHSCALAIKGGS